MATITDFENWLGQIELGEDGYEDVYSLYRCIIECGTWGRFTCKKDSSSGKKFITTSDVAGDTLMLASEKAEKFFIAHITKLHCGDLDMEGWYSYNHNMSKND